MEKENKKNLVRSDVNIEKWSLFSTQRQKGPKVIVRYKTLPDGTQLTRKVTIRLPIGAEEGKIFYLLKSLWEEKGRPESGQVFTSLHNIFNRLFPKETGQENNKKTLSHHGNWSKKWFKEKITNLLGSVIIFENAYENKDGTLREYESFTLLSNAKIFERKKYEIDHPYFGFSNFTIHPVIVRALLEKNVKPIRLDVIMKFKSEIAFVLYRWIDIVMFDKTQLERNVRDLADELSLGAKRLDHLVVQMRKACNELRGKDLTTGRIIYCEVEKTIDKSGWKLVVKKGKQEVIDHEHEKIIEVEQLVTRKIKYKNSKAKSVALVGTFNNWQPEDMVRFVDEWSMLLELEPGKYHYKFIVDGVWICDPENPNRITDNQGNENSVLVVQ